MWKILASFILLHPVLQQSSWLGSEGAEFKDSCSSAADPSLPILTLFASCLFAARSFAALTCFKYSCIFDELDMA
ncbi:hypothetical protein AYI69_g10185 [Smittium culicis]|uniref:Secreted protein n=1 Tax=Smittium culicis TaxID=133412 RepID=A0A1R1X7L2_9FUNG|nr:hypothetical protein AYI69_g10185 [Smittium culicis]